MEQVAPLAVPSDYLGLFNEVSAGSAFVGNDSGPAHLAGILGRPTLCMFGPTSPDTWRPLGPKVRTVHRELDTIGVDEVAEIMDC